MSARLTYLTTILPKLARRLVRDARGPGVTHHTKPDGPLFLQPCHLDRKNPVFAELVPRDIDRLAAGLALIIQAARDLAAIGDVPPPVATWPRLVGPCKQACSSDIPVEDLFELLGGDVHPRGRDNGPPTFPPDDLRVRYDERARILGAFTPAIGYLLRAMGRRYRHEAMTKLADRYDGGVGSPMQRKMEEEVGSTDAPDLVFPRNPVVGQARVAIPRPARMVEYLKEDFADDIAWIRNGAPTVPCCEPYEANGAVTLSPERLGRRNRRIAEWSLDRRDRFAIGLFWAVLLDQAVYTWRREQHAGWVKTLPAPFPKLIGDCPGGCGSHLHPYRAIEAVGRPIDPAYGARVIERRNNLLQRSIAEMKPCALSLFEGANIRSPEELWERCEKHLPNALESLTLLASRTH